MVYIQSTQFSTKTKVQNQQNSKNQSEDLNGSGELVEAQVQIDEKLFGNKQDKKKKSRTKSKNSPKEALETNSQNDWEVTKVNNNDAQIPLESNETALVRQSNTDKILQNEICNSLSIQNRISNNSLMQTGISNISSGMHPINNSLNGNGQTQLVVSNTVSSTINMKKGVDANNLVDQQNSQDSQIVLEETSVSNGTTLPQNGALENVASTPKNQNDGNVQDVQNEAESEGPGNGSPDSITKNSKTQQHKQVNEDTLRESREFFQALFSQPEPQIGNIINSVTGNRVTGILPVTEIKGIGQVHKGLLEKAGCGFVWQLLFYFQFRFGGDPSKLKDYLKGIGIKNHHRMIVDHLKKELVRNSVITLEGNIGAGKTTFLNALAPHLGEKIKVFEEPVAEWQEVNNTVKISDDQPDNFNLLQEFYSHPKTGAFSFQTYVLLSKISSLAYTKDPFRTSMEIPDCVSREYLEKIRRVHLLERSVYADRLVFVRSLHSNGQLNDAEVSIYDHWFNKIINQDHKNLNPDGLIYLRAEPSVCEARMRKRNRVEESEVDYTYLYNLHQMHEDWLHSDSFRNVDDDYVKNLLTNRRKCRSKVELSQGDRNMTDSETYAKHYSAYEKVQELLYDALDITQLQQIPQVPDIFLNNKMAQLHFIDPDQKTHLGKYPGIIGVPTLEIDWNQDWDIHGDTQRQLEVANIVEEFVNYVSKYKVLTRLPELFPSQFTYWD
eukprot:TRINITY_DN3755_c1_g1_i6.p1 TRINITY_DN3755_c1_g1~~TRINITY_DN3755_c1_g1_i6.p1  ORF type:complete len:723 (-),score=101.61 TRINITY_DN3755_c1_g1_i6:3163-5331(-)